VLQAGPIDDGHAGEDPVEVLRIALGYRQSLPPALGGAHKVGLLRRAAVGSLYKSPGRVVNFLVGGVSEVAEGFVVQREGLRRFAGLGLVA